MDIKAKKKALSIFYFNFFVLGFSLVIIEPLIPVISENMKVGYDKIGIALFVGSIAIVLANFLSGRLSDRSDIKKLVLSGMALIFLCFVLFGIYLNYIIFVIAIIFLRAGFGTVNTTVHSFSSKLNKKNVSRTFINLDIAWYAGATFGPLVISGVLYFGFLPRYLFIIIASIYIIIILIFYWIFPKKEIQENKRSLAVSKNHSWRQKFSFLKDPVVIIASLMLFFYLGSLSGLSAWLTTYFLSLGVRVAFGSAFLSLYWLFSIIGMIIGTRIIYRFKEINILFYGCLGGIVFLTLFSFIPDIYVKIFALAMSAIFFSVVFPLTTSISAQRDQKNSGTILGFITSVGFAGSIVFQPVFGYIAEYFGGTYIIYIVLGGALLGFLFTGILFRVIHKNPQKKLSKI